jgi:hypothetical protein
MEGNGQLQRNDLAVISQLSSQAFQDIPQLKQQSPRTLISSRSALLLGRWHCWRLFFLSESVDLCAQPWDDPITRRYAGGRRFMPSELILGRRTNTSRSIGFAIHAHPAAGEPFTYAGDGHLITFAPTGTGKTSGPVICNSLKHPASSSSST